MARLLQLRLVSIGHPNARFGDVTLDFTRAGAPADSTVWLRNGGGKSSLLSLFFGLVRPDLREFLGARADAGQRRLDQYVGEHDRAVIAATWELDDGATFLTGAFYERKSGTGELRKLWFSGLTAIDEPRATLAGLPLTTEAGRRRVLAGFREEWQTLRQQRPELQLAATEVQREWAERLRAASIDPELFSYQLRMNTREGGADELFRFGDHESFVDFLIELAFSPEHADEVSQNVSRYREQLRLRKEQYLPERELVTALSTRMEPLAQLAGERAHLLRDATAASQASHELARHVAQRHAAEEARAARVAAEIAAAVEARRMAEARAQEALVRAAQLACFAATARHQQAEHDASEIDRRYREADRARKLWGSARTLRELRRREHAAAELGRQLAIRQADQEPLRQVLAQAALSYAGALEAALARQREQQCAALAATTAARAEAREHRGLATRRRAEASEHERTIAVLEAAQAAARRELARLDAAGLLAAGERIEQAEARWGEQASTARAAETRWAARMAELSDEALVARERGDALARELGQLESRVVVRRQALERSRAEQSAIEALPALARVLDDPAPDLERAGELETRLAQRLAALEARLLEHREARSHTARSLHHLRSEGYLPPSAPVAQLVEHIAGHLPGARSGWKEIATNGPSGAAARRQLVERHPQLATGVIVRDVDWERACELARAAPPPEVPVVIAPQRALAGAAGEGFVVGPASDAYFDGDAARAEMARLEAVTDDLDRALRSEAGEHEQLTALRDAYRGFRARHPRGWRALHESELADLERDAAGCAGDHARAKQHLAGLEAEREAALAEARASAGRAHAADDALRQLGNYRLQHPGDHAETLATTRATARALAEEAATLEACASAAEEQGAAAEREGRALAATEGRLLHERGRVRHLDAPVAATRGDVAALAAVYEEHLRIYEQRVGADGLLLARQHEEAAARTAREQLLRELARQSFGERDVAAALDGLGPDEQVEDREEIAGAEANALFSQNGNVAKEVKRWQEARSAAERRCTELGVGFVPAAGVAGPAHALEEAALAEQEATVARADVAAAEARIVLGRREEEHSRLASVALRALTLRAATLRERFDESFALDELTGGTPAWPDDDALEPAVETLERRLAELRGCGRALDLRRDAAAAQLQAICASEVAERLISPIPRRLRGFDGAALESSALSLLAELGRRAAVLDAELAELGRHREVLVKAALDVAESALKLLRDAEKQSRLPTHLRWGGGETFMRISVGPPDAPAEREARMAELVDQLATEGNIPGGVGFVQRALRRLARPIRVKIAFPEPGRGLRVVDIPETARFSGGEQLTCAILLYCTLAQLRARRRASARRPSSVLLLDNPIGRASRASFLELQREVARAMDIQLVYTTGVQDLEAVGALPNVIRLRNERVDRTSGAQVVELETEVVAARLARLEPPAS